MIPVVNRRAAVPGSTRGGDRAKTDRSILFGAPMVRAILAGVKTQTRRVIRWPEWIIDREAAAYRLQTSPGLALYVDGRLCRTFTCPYGQPGDRLWVRETFCERSGDLLYRADGKFEQPRYCVAFEGEDRWRPSIHMPRWASRLDLPVVSTRVERLRAISEADARAEGVTSVAEYAVFWDSINGKRPGCSWDDSPWVWCVEFASVAR